VQLSDKIQPLILIYCSIMDTKMHSSHRQLNINLGLFTCDVQLLEGGGGLGMCDFPYHFVYLGGG